MNRLYSFGLVAVVIGLASVAHANQHLAQRDGDSILGEWGNSAFYEPCMNGSVSASGLYPSQTTEDKSLATLGVLAR